VPLLSPSPPLSINRTHPSSSPSSSSLSFPHSLPPRVVVVLPEPCPARRRRRAEARPRSPVRPLGHAPSRRTIRALLTRTPCSPSPPCTRASAQGRRRSFCVLALRNSENYFCIFCIKNVCKIDSRTLCATLRCVRVIVNKPRNNILTVREFIFQKNKLCH
jgi:hypothetical protein